MMEDNRRDPSSDFDSEYIDQLFSVGRTPAKQESPSAPAPQPEPEPVVPETPATIEPVDKPFPKALLVLIAIALWGIGFLIGWFARGGRPPQEEASTTTTQPTSTWINIDTVPSTDSGIAVDYAAMSTKQLADIAIRIRELSSYGAPNSKRTLTVHVYQDLRFANPVLLELARRPDAVEQLTAAATTASDLDSFYAASALIRYYTVHLGFDSVTDLNVTPECQWLHSEDAYIRVFEYTEAPLVTHTFTQATIFDFQGTVFMLEGERFEEHEDDPNFWYRLELTLEVDEDQIVSMPYPSLSWSGSSSDTWVTVQRYDKGWFVYGYAAGKTTLSVSIQPYGNPHEIQLIVSPVPGDEESPAAFAQCFLDQAAALQSLSAMNADKKLQNYPIVSAVLEKPGCISVLLNLAQATNDYENDLPYPGRKNALDSLLSNSFFSRKMTISESHALRALRDYGKYLDPTSLPEPAIVETAEGFILTGLPGLHVGDKPENLKDIPLSEMNYWAYVPLTEDVIMLQQSNWDLGITANSTCVAGAWPVRDSNDQLAGWVISGQLKWDCLLHLDLLQGNGTVFSTSIHAEPLNT